MCAKFRKYLLIWWVAITVTNSTPSNTNEHFSSSLSSLAQIMRVVRGIDVDVKGRKFVSVPWNYLNIKLCGRCLGGVGAGGMREGEDGLIYVSFKHDFHIKIATSGLVLSLEFMKQLLSFGWNLTWCLCNTY